MFDDKWGGFFACDTWADDYSGRYAVVNLSQSTSLGGHWVAFNGVYWYDSFKNNGILQDIEETRVDDFTCRQRCLSYLLLSDENESLAELL